MIPSRGLRWSGQVIGIGRRRIGVATLRQFSSSNVQHAPIKGNPLLSQKGSSIAQLSARSQFSRTNILIRNGAGVRFASGGPVLSTAASTTPVTPADAASSAAEYPTQLVPESLDSVTDWTVNSLADTPHYIGYLKDLGLQYGYGPTALMEWIIEHVHVFAGTPWWATIALTAVLIRAVTFKFYIIAADNGTRMQATMPLTKPLTTKMMEAQARGDTAGIMEVRQEIQRINKRAGVSMSKSFLPMLGAISTFGTFNLLRAMSKVPVPGMETGGILWFQDLTIPDPYFLLPIITAGFMHWVLRRGGETGSSNLQPQMLKIFMWLMPALSLAFTWWLPASVQVTFFTTGLLSLLQAVGMSKPWFREFLGMLPIRKPPHNPDEAPRSPYQGKMNRSPALSQAELNARFQSITTSSPHSSDPLSGLKKIISKPLKPVENAMKPSLDQYRASMEARKEKAEKRKMQDYEDKRKKEIAESKRRRSMVLEQLREERRLEAEAKKR